MHQSPNRVRPLARRALTSRAPLDSPSGGGQCLPLEELLPHCGVGALPVEDDCVPDNLQQLAPSLLGYGSRELSPLRFVFEELNFDELVVHERLVNSRD